MLVLTRKSQESVVVGRPSGVKDMFKVTVLQIKAGHVRLGFEADKDCLIHRWEVWEQIRTREPTAFPAAVTRTR